VVTGGDWDETAKVWDAKDGKLILDLKVGKSGVCSVAISPDGRRVGVATALGTVELWDALTRRSLFSMPGQWSVESVVFSPDSRRMATGTGADNAVKIWEAATSEQVAAWQKEDQEGAFPPP
jgi:WD40 repeat protein